MQRCKAKSKRSGKRCKNYAVRGSKVCRMHGAGSGPRTDEGKIICRMASFKHGYYAEEAILERRNIKKLRKSTLLEIE